MSKKSILELANEIKKEKGTYSSSSDYSLRKAIQNSMEAVPYLKECYVVERFIANYINDLYTDKTNFLIIESNKNYYKEFYEGVEVLSDYNPCFNLFDVDNETNNKKELGVFNVSYNNETEAININIKLELEKLGVIEDIIVIEKSNIGRLVIICDDIEEFICDCKPHLIGMREDEFYKNLIYRISINKDRDWGVFNILIELVDALIVLINREKELKENKNRRFVI